MEAFGLLEGMVGRQAAMLAYNHVFFLIALLFLLLVPLALLVRDPQRAKGAQMTTD